MFLTFDEFKTEKSSKIQKEQKEKYTNEYNKLQQSLLKKYNVTDVTELNDSDFEEYTKTLSEKWKQIKSKGFDKKVQESMNEASLKDSNKKEYSDFVDKFASKLYVSTIQQNKLGNKYYFEVQVNPKDEKDVIKYMDDNDLNYMKDKSNNNKYTIIIQESAILEKDVKSKEDFSEYAKAFLKKAHGEDYDEDKAKKIIDALSKEAEKSDDWGVAVGKLQNS